MAIKIRLSRQGGKKNPEYLVIAVDGMKKRDGEYTEKLGYYFPKAKAPKDKIKVNAERVAYWIKAGAVTTQTVGQLLKVAAK